MLKSLLKAVGLLAILAWSGFVFAVGMGNINVTSALGRPLKAEIPLVTLENADKSSITVKLASPNEFKNAGIDYPYALPKLKIEIETRDGGDPYVKLSTTQPVNEPFVSLLLELSWSAGKLMREYTFLLDPEGFVAEQPKAAEVQPVEPVAPLAATSAVPVDAAAVPPLAAEPAPLATEPAVVAPAEQAAAPTEMPAPAEMPAPVESASGTEGVALGAAPAPSDVPAQPDVAPDMEAKDMAAESAPAAATDEATAPAKEAAAATESVTVKRGDTLAKIAAQTKPAEVSLERMVVALYHANSKEFDGKNMNRLRTGKILLMPESEAISNVTQVAAVKEIHAHVADWHAYRQKLAAAQGQAAEQAPKQADAGKVTTAVAEKAPVTKEPAKEVLKLSKGEAPGDKQVAAGVASKQEKRIAKADDALAKEKQLQEEQKRAAELEKIRKEGSKLVELKTQAAESKPVVAELAASAPVAAASAVPVSKPKIVMPVKTAAAPPSLLDELLDNPIYIGGAIAVLLGLGGLGFVLVRRLRSKGDKKKSESRKEFKIEPIGSATGSWVAPVPPSPETGDFTTQSAPVIQPAAVEADDVDPIGEAELFLNFGRDAQAEEVLKEALSKNPSNIPVKLKLLSIYVNRKDVTSFSKYAREIQQTGDAAAWEQVAAMGRTVDPGNPTYGGGEGMPASHAAEPAAAVDFDLGLGKPAAEPAAKEFSMDFDVTGTHPGIAGKTGDAQASAGVLDVSGILPGEVARSAQETPMDFDVSGILPGEVMRAAQKAEMDFDISSTQIMRAPAASTMDFDVTGSGAELTVPAAPAAAAPALNFGDLVFEMPASQPSKTEEAPKPAPVADEGMPFMIDFPMGDAAETSSQKAGTSSKLDMDFADISLNLDTPAPSAGGDAKSEHWHEVATKLDLAKAYQEMGDAAGAREILDEVVRDGDEQQREAAEKLLQQLSA